MPFFRAYLSILFFGLAAQSAQAAIITNAWVPIFKGIDFATGEADTNEVRQQKVSVLRVDLLNPAVEMFSTPSNGSGDLETYGQTTTTFVNSYGVAVGVNANFFSPVTTISNDPRELSGLAISQGTLVSPAESIRPMLLITRSNIVTITATVPSNPSNYWTAVSGSNLILIDGVPQLANCDTSFCNENPRTAVGVSMDGRYLYMMTIDGRRAGWSDGATLAETGAWLQRFGAWRGLNLDGGGSTAMAKVENGAAILLNRTSGSVQRVNGNHLGVFAPTLAPIILTQPQSQTARIGSNVTFTVNAGGTTPLRYQWRFNGAGIPGKTNTSLTLSNLTASNSGNYSVIVSNLAGLTASSNAALTVVFPLDITNLTVVRRPSSAIVSWTSEPKTISQIEYGIAPSFGNFVPFETSLRTNHSFLLVGLMPNTNYHFRIISRIDPHEIVSGPYAFSTDLNIIVDNPQATYSGDWIVGSSAAGKFGSNYHFATTQNSSEPTAEATYAPTIPTPGKYDVAIWYPQGSNRTTNAPVTAVGSTGSIQASMNQTTGGGAWRLIAPALNCVAGIQSHVLIGNHTGETNKVVMADAVRWAYNLSQDIPTDGSVPAWWSDIYFSGNIDPSLDHDQDGYSTSSEYVLGTIPTDAGSRLDVTPQRTSSGLNFMFSPWLGGRIYELQSNTNLAGGIWNTLSNAPAVTNQIGVFPVSNSGQINPSFYRLSVRLAP